MISTVFPSETACTGGTPPECCQPPATVERVLRHWRGHRLEAAQERSAASYPRSCPRCGSTQVYWVFDVERPVFECGCGNVWEDAR